MKEYPDYNLWQNLLEFKYIILEVELSNKLKNVKENVLERGNKVAVQRLTLNMFADQITVLVRPQKCLC
jgi:hypothetical protein